MSELHGEALGMWTDLGDLAQAAAAFVHGRHNETASFEFSICKQPAQRNYLVYAGLETLLNRLQQFHFTSEQIEYLRYHPAFAGVPLGWFDHLRQLRFQGDVWSAREGTMFVSPAPVLRITAPFDVACLVSSLVTGTLTHPIKVASKVTRLLSAASGRMLIEMGIHQGMDQATSIATTRTAYLAGVLTTTHAEAARMLQLPTHALMPHDWPMLYRDEVEAFHRYGQLFSTMCIPVVDTFETLGGIRHAIASGAPLQALRLDSGDLLTLSLEARKMLDAAGRRHVKLIGSGTLDEDKIARLIAQQAPLDGFAVGTSLATSADAPVLNSVYKLVAHQLRDGTWEPGYKLTLGKRNYPWPKLVYRFTGEDGSFDHDVIALERETLEGEPLLARVMTQGSLSQRLPSLEECRDFCLMQRVRMPADLLELTPAKKPYPIRYSDALEKEMARVSRGFRK